LLYKGFISIFVSILYSFSLFYINNWNFSCHSRSLSIKHCYWLV